MLAYIWAESDSHVIGKDGKLPWYLPDDMHFFKQTTLNHQILAGKTTYLSFGRPLPRRKNLVLTHEPQADFPDGVETFDSVQNFLRYADQFINEKIFVVGGRAVYRALLPYVDYLYRTTIEHEFDGDTTMVPIDYSQFTLEKTIPGVEDDKNLYPHHFDIFKRK